MKSFDTVRGDRSRGQPALNPTAQNCTLSCVRFFFSFMSCVRAGMNEVSVGDVC